MNPATNPLAAAELRARAEAAHRAQAAAAPLSPEAAQPFLHELQVHQIELEMQNEELRRAQHELALSRARYFDLYDLAPVGYGTVSEAGTVLQANLALSTLLGVVRSALVQQHFSRFILKDDQDKYFQWKQRVLAPAPAAPEPPATSPTTDLRLLRVDGTTVWVNLVAGAATGDSGEPALRLVVTDINARRAREAAERLEAQTQSEILNAIPAHVALVDTEGITCVTNESWRRFATANFLQGPEFSLGQNYLKVGESATGPCSDEARDAAAGIRRVLRGETSEFAIEYPCHSPTEQRWFRLMATPLREGIRDGAVVMYVNITERKQAEATLLHTTDMLELTGELGKIGGWSVALPTMKLTWTRETFRIAEIETGVEPPLEEGINLFAPEARPVIAAAVQAAIDTGTPYDLELPLITAKGNHRWVRTQGYAESQDGRVVRIFGTFQDITERKAAEAALRESEQRWRFALEGAGDGLWDWNVSAGTVFFSRRFIEMLGFVEHEFSNRLEERSNRVHPDDLPRAMADVQRHFEGATPGYANEHRCRCKDGSWKWILDRGLVIARDAAGKPVRMIGMHTDITERKLADEALRASEARFRTLVEHSPYCIHEIDRAGQLTSMNAAGLKMMGVDDVCAIQGRPYLEGVGPRDRERIAGLMAGALAGQASEFAFQGHNGSAYQSSFVPIMDGRGVVQRLMGLSIDITAQKLVADNLRQSEARARAIIEASLVAKALNDEAGNITFLNPAFTGTFGYELADIPTLADWWPKAYPDSAYRQWVVEAWQAELSRAAQTGTAFIPLEVTIRCKDGTERIALAAATPLEEAFAGSYFVVLLDISERKQAETALQKNQALLLSLTESTTDAIFVKDTLGRYLLFNDAASRFVGKPVAEVLGRDDRALFPPEQAHQIMAGDHQIMASGHTQTNEEAGLATPNGPTTFLATKGPIRNAQGKVIGLFGISRDITERRQLQNQLRESQKMEAIGQLAGGIAHDFNNILSVIQGYGTLLQAAPTFADVADAADQIVKAAGRAAELTRQLLAFSRRQAMQPRVLDLNEIVTGMLKMLGRVLGEDLRLGVNLDSRALLTRADAGMLEQVLLNLAVNARDAMPDGGRLEVATGEVTFTAAEVKSLPDLAPGHHVWLRVSDTGIGIAPEHLARIFEPFFTTKEVGKGTGLGLATVFGIVKQHGGAVTVASEVGRGTAFKIYLPATEAEVPAPVIKPAAPATRGGGETILLVEDDPDVRKLTRRVLERAGYQILEAADGIAGERVGEEHTGEIRLLLTDIMMPEGVSGRTLATHLEAKNPRLQVIFTSGYDVTTAGRELSLHEGEEFLQKPVPLALLLETVRRSLDR